MANDRLTIPDGHNRGHGNLALRLPRLIDRPAFAYEVIVGEVRHGDAALGGAEVNADGPSIKGLSCECLAKFIEYGGCFSRWAARNGAFATHSQGRLREHGVCGASRHWRSSHHSSKEARDEEDSLHRYRPALGGDSG